MSINSAIEKHGRHLKQDKRTFRQIFFQINDYRYFEGPLPVLVTSDLDIVKEVFIKDFSKFTGRKVRHAKLLRKKAFYFKLGWSCASMTCKLPHYSKENKN
jgi:hypothetical protein